MSSECVLARVMIVEDEFLIAADLECAVEDAGCQSVGIASDTDEALALANETPDLALVDLNLSDGPTGVEIARSLIARGISVLFITGNPRLLKGGVPGAFGVVQKPCTPEIIRRIVSYAIDRRRGVHVSTPEFVRSFA